ncbi:MAG: DsbA family protein, partial [Alphaproteobacteria bacterium]|nr:DsbA family protein [Alphaproteobacteria bacterium]
IHDALYRAYFVDCVNVGDVEALLKVAAAVGLDVDAAREVLESRSFKASVDEDWNKSRQYGVTGVPTFIAGRQGVVGAQPYEALEQLLQEAGVERRN